MTYKIANLNYDQVNKKASIAITGPNGMFFNLMFHIDSHDQETQEGLRHKALHHAETLSRHAFQLLKQDEKK